MQRLLNNPRDIQLQIKYKDMSLPYFTEGWEDLFIKSNDYEKSIHMINFFTEKRKKFNIDHFNINKSKYLEICFERFVRKPDLYLEKIINLSNTKYTNKTKKYLKKNKIPRDKFSDGIPLNVYKRSGWKPPKKYLSEKDELYERRKIVENNNISEFGLDILDKLCKEYEQKYKIEELF